MIRKLMPLWGQARTAVLTLAGFGGLTAAAWTVTPGLGLAAGGVSCLVLEYLTSDGGRTR
ncbi:hypothetical protein ACFY1A_20905 [Streptomyces sp. NPDC001520]|uniref:hypothetical protein n=1 Tax=Streptomyces sp. NPDC001520 TaxID=3364581 RepID=UPI00369BC732